MDQYLRKTDDRKLATPRKTVSSSVPYEVDTIVLAELREWIEILSSHRSRRD